MSITINEVKPLRHEKYYVIIYSENGYANSEKSDLSLTEMLHFLQEMNEQRLVYRVFSHSEIANMTQEQWKESHRKLTIYQL